MQILVTGSASANTFPLNVDSVTERESVRAPTSPSSGHAVREMANGSSRSPR